MPCVFCDRSFAGDLVYEDDDALVIVHEDWSVRAHLMVASKRHVENASALAPDEWQRLTSVYRHAERAALDATGADRAIMLKLGIQTPHLHLHIYPVSASLSRSDVMEIIDAKVQVPRDESLVTAIRAALDTSLRRE